MSDDLAVAADGGDELDLFGEKVDAYKTLRERMGVWPMTVWPHSHQDPAHRRLLELIGDDGEARAGVLHKRESGGVYDVSASIFSPSVASWCYNLWGPRAGAGTHGWAHALYGERETGMVYDPFAGGGTRAVMAAKSGYRYRGVDLRAVEVAAVRARAAKAGCSDLVELVVGDSQEVHYPVASADFLLTCPPYYNLEEYGGGPEDLSAAPSYGAFVEMMRRVVRGCAYILKPGALAVWVIGLHREAKTGELLPLHHDLAEVHRSAGWLFREEVIIHQLHNGSIQRVGAFEKGRQFLVRSHEYALCFRNTVASHTAARAALEPGPADAP